MPDLALCSRELTAQGIGWPCLLVDRSRLDANIARAGSFVRGDKLRIVVKSLPCPELIDRVMKALGTHHLMVFHLPFLLEAATRWPGADIMLGKPLPPAAVNAFYRQAPLRSTFDHETNLHWLVDTPERVMEHARIARGHNVRMQVIVELDVGMHRGGVRSEADLLILLEQLEAFSDYLVLRGFMGYDAHAGKGIPWLTREHAIAKANRHYRLLLECAQRNYPALMPGVPICNGGGSPTFIYHGQDSSPLSEVAIGSIFVKPAEFDLPQLQQFEPACWIAAPVIKRLSGVSIPYLEWLSALSRRDTLFIYGGRWPSRPCWPAGLREGRLYGSSFNQQFMTVPRSTRVRPNEFVFFRPLQSESVMRSLGPIVVMEKDRVVDEWSVFKEPEAFAGLDSRSSKEKV